jgi:hypothetical protein
MGVGHGLSDAPRDGDDFVEGQLVLRLEPFIKGLSGEELHGQVGAAGLVAGIEDADQIGVEEPGTQLGFLVEPGPELRIVHPVKVGHLQGDFLPGIAMVGEERV